jgi:L-phenylalanine/L-methionine N-acetyltransferase
MKAPESDPEAKLPPSHVAEGELVIRSARLSDCEGITELVNMPGYRAGTLRLPFHSLEETRRWFENSGPNALHIVAAIGDRIVGNAGLERLSGRRSHVGHIGMGVRDDWQRRGIGTALLGALVDAADNWLGLLRLELTVYVDNESAIRLYEKFGFEREGVCRAYAFRNGRYEDTIAMARLARLSAGHPEPVAVRK